MDVSTVRQWVMCVNSVKGDNSTPPPAQILLRVACRLLFIAAKNASLMVVAMLDNGVL